MEYIKEKIKLADGHIYDIKELYSYDHLFTIVFDDNINIRQLIQDTSVFKIIKILTRMGLECDTYLDYTTVYSLNRQTLVLSNDGSVFTKPKPDKKKELILTLNQIKNEKISSLSAICQNKIYQGISLLIDGKEESFTYNPLDQNNIKEVYELAVQTQKSVPYHSNGNGCRLYSLEQITQIYVQQRINLTQHTTYFNQLKMYITNELNDKEQIQSVTYGDELTGQYLKNYNAMVNQTVSIVESLK